MKKIKLIESTVPEVGPFYVIDNVVYADTESKNEVTPVQGNYDSNNSHYDYYRSLKRFLPEFRNHDYDYYPRGRVVYSMTKDKYYLYIDKCLNSQKYIDLIINELNLPYNKVIVDTDEHYQCHNCNQDYIDIEENYIPENLNKNFD